MAMKPHVVKPYIGDDGRPVCLVCDEHIHGTPAGWFHVGAPAADPSGNERVWNDGQGAPSEPQSAE